jgi:hypothetical protein
VYDTQRGRLKSHCQNRLRTEACGTVGCMNVRHAKLRRRSSHERHERRMSAEVPPMANDETAIRRPTACGDREARIGCERPSLRDGFEALPSRVRRATKRATVRIHSRTRHSRK